MKIRLTLLFSLFTVAIFAQMDHDPRLLVKYESSLLDRMASKHQVAYQKLTYYLDHGYQIIDQNDIKFKDLKDYVVIDDMDHINLYQIELEQNIQADYKARKVLSWPRILSTVTICQPKSVLNGCDISPSRSL